MSDPQVIFVVCPFRDSKGFWSFFASFVQALFEKERNLTPYLPRGLFLPHLFSDSGIPPAAPDPFGRRQEFISMGKLIDEWSHEERSFDLKVVPLNPWNFFYGDLPDKFFEFKKSTFVLSLKSSFEDMASSKRLAGSLFAGGVSRGNLFFVLLNDGGPGVVSSRIIEREIGAPLVQFAVESGASDLFTDGGLLTLRKTLDPKKGRHVRSLVDSVLGRMRDGGAANEGHSNDIDWRDIEEKVAERLWNLLNDNGGVPISRVEDIENLIERELHAVIWDKEIFNHSLDTVRAVERRILDQIIGLGPIETFLKDESINEIMVNGSGRIFIEKNGTIVLSDKKFINQAHLKVMIDRMVGEVGRRVDTSSPLCDLRLKNGSRVNIVLPPLSLEGPLVTVRRFRPHILSLEKLTDLGSITFEEGQYLQSAVRSKKNILIAGNSGSGKTTLLNILSHYIDDAERIITLEDAAELKLQKAHVVRLETRPKNSEGMGEINMHDLVINALRMRPDRLIIGECRGSEVIPMIQALNTGHNGSMTTIHANSSEDAVRRLEAMILMAAPQWPINVVREQICAAIHLIVFLAREGATRKLHGMGEVKLEEGVIKVIKVEANR